MLNAAGVPCGEIYSIDQVFARPRSSIWACRRHGRQERGPTQVVGQPITLSRTGSSVKHPPPTYSQHTDEILADLGYSSADISKMHDDGTV